MENRYFEVLFRLLLIHRCPHEQSPIWMEHPTVYLIQISVLFFCNSLWKSRRIFTDDFVLNPESNRLNLGIADELQSNWQRSTFKFILYILFHIRIILLVIRVDKVEFSCIK